ncbi:MAG TPA: methionine--tRNA ligase [Dehalococcoidia bacterium]|nr:methionine--tRNA ligase [Dehalococcoidia bacterium]
MSEHIFIGVAWPYANGSLHLGHIAGAYLPADIFARYHRLKGNHVLMVSGSDQHGAPITMRAEQEKVSPQQIVDKYQKEFSECWQKLGISFDLFTNTGTANHTQVVQDIFLKLLSKGYIYKDSMMQAYCPSCKRFLPDRYIEGICPHCQYVGARGDQCDQCGRTLNPTDLINIHCRICSGVPRFESSEHFFLRLNAFEDQLKSWLSKKEYWRPNVLKFSLGILDGGLKDRAITRDLEWGIVIPQPGFENKRIYVWFEAVIGYLSASKEWAVKSGDENAWKPFWSDSAKTYYFIGKDNIPFHTLIWPSMLLGYGGLPLPYDVPANEFLTIEGKKLSTSRNWAVWVPDYLERYDPDPLRYLLSVTMPDNGDTDFSWRAFLRKNNDELVATYGNLVHRVLTFINRHFDGIVPDGGEYDTRSQDLLHIADKTLRSIDQHIGSCHFKEAIKTAMVLAQEANKYLDEKAPWKMIKQDRKATAMSLVAILSVIATLKIVLYPFLPFSSQKLHMLLGFDSDLEEDGWKIRIPPAGTKLPQPQPLFSKLDDKIVEEEMVRLTGA